MKALLPIAAIATTLSVLIACPPPPPPPKNACESISIPSIPPGTGSLTVCVLPSECREDMVAPKMDSAICADKSAGSCPAGGEACSNACVGTVLSSGLKVTAGSCTWDRNSECIIPGTDAGKGGNCTCSWSIPAGSSISCGCGCR